jgi:hypothetical protein
MGIAQRYVQAADVLKQLPKKFAHSSIGTGAIYPTSDFFKLSLC